MTASKRIAKQALVLALTLLFIYGVFWTGRQIFAPPAPEPTIDPRTLLDPIDVLFEGLIEVGENDYDFVARVRNPNTGYGGAKVEYQLTLQDEQGQNLETLNSSFYILPGQTRYVVVTQLQTANPATRGELRITKVDWQELDVLGESGVDLIVTDIRHGAPENPSVFYQAGADVFNKSSFSLDMIDIVIVAFGQQNQPLAVNVTDMRTLLAEEQRGFESPWFNEFDGEVATVIVEAYTNLFENDNFLRTQGTLERFQLTY